MSAGPSGGRLPARSSACRGAAIVLFRLHRDRLLVRDRRVGFVLIVWALYTILGGIREPFIDNGAHIGGALGGAHRALPPPGRALAASPERAATMRRWLWLVAALAGGGADRLGSLPRPHDVNRCGPWEVSEGPSRPSDFKDRGPREAGERGRGTHRADDRARHRVGRDEPESREV